MLWKFPWTLYLRDIQNHDVIVCNLLSTSMLFSILSFFFSFSAPFLSLSLALIYYFFRFCLLFFSKTNTPITILLRSVVVWTRASWVQWSNRSWTMVMFNTTNSIAFPRRLYKYCWWSCWSCGTAVAFSIRIFITSMLFSFIFAWCNRNSLAR